MQNQLFDQHERCQSWPV